MSNRIRVFNKKIFWLLLLLFFTSVGNCNQNPGIDTISKSPGIYDTNLEFYRIGFLNAYAITYIEKVEILSDFQFKIHYKWVGDIAPGFISYFQKGSDETNTNMYVADDLNNRYDHINSMGMGSFILYNGDVQRGWYLFPALNQNANFITIHDDDQQEFISIYFQ